MIIFVSCAEFFAVLELIQGIPKGEKYQKYARRKGREQSMLTIVTFVAFTALVAIISWFKTRDDNLSTKEGYFLAGRGLSGLVIAGSLEMTNLSTEQLVGQAGQSYATNMGAMNWSVSASFALLCLAMIFLPRYL